jgi:hypothetical protein
LPGSAVSSKLVLVLAFAVASHVGAQRVVRGTVRTEQGQLMGGVELRVQSLNRSVRSDSTGEYRIPLPPGSYWLTTRALGYVSEGADITIDNNADLIRNFTLKALAMVLDTVTAEAPARKYLSPTLADFEERRRTGQGRYVTEEVFQRNAHGLLSDVLRRVPGLLIRPGRNGTYNAATSRVGMGGRAGCFVAVYLDGLPLYNGPGTGPLIDINEFRNSTLAAAEFYASAATSPVKYKDRTGCGMLLLWTRER